MYTLKVFVSIVMTPEISHIINVVDEVLHKYLMHAVITSAADGEHSKPHSLHYRNCAVDFRTYDWPTRHKYEILQDIKARLGADYDVVNEVTHLHVEYDPK